MSKILLCLLMVLSSCRLAHASTERITTMFRPNCYPIIGHTCRELADAIFKAENSKKYPYGIKTKYRHTNPRMACINTIHSSVRTWLVTDQRQPFLDHLQSTYCPSSDKGCDVWVKNVSYWLRKG